MRSTFTRTGYLSAVLLLLGAVCLQSAQAQDPLGDEFIFFVDGSNVLVPIYEGSNVADPAEPGSMNIAAKFETGGWGEVGWRWSPNNALDVPEDTRDLTANVGDNAFEGDTLYFSLRSDPNNKGEGTFGVVFLDFQNEELNPKNYEMRAFWSLPDWYHDGEWHDFVVPLPPATLAALDSAKAGKNVDGTPLAAELDSLVQYWSYPGGWSDSEASFKSPGTDGWTDFEWNSVSGLIPLFIDNACTSGCGPFWLDNVYIGGPNTDISSATEPPSPMGPINVAADGAFNRISWTANPEVSKYTVYVDKDPITDPLAEGVQMVDQVDFDAEALEVLHQAEYPHASLAGAPFYYAVTGQSGFGVENLDVSASSGQIANGAVSPSINMLLRSEADELFDDILGAGLTAPGALAQFEPFVVDENHSREADASLPAGGDTDLSMKAWIGIDPEFQEMWIYAEVTDDTLGFKPGVPTGDDTGNALCNPPGTGTFVCGADAWQYDSVEMNWGSYDVDWFDGSPHADLGGTEERRTTAPDYQLRFGPVVDDVTGEIIDDPFGDIVKPGPNGFTHTNPGTAAGSGPINLSTINAEAMEGGYKFLTLLPMENWILGSDPDPVFDPPADDEIRIVPFNIYVNDRDEDSAGRQSQIQWSIRPNAESGGWQTPTMWQPVAVVGRNVATAVEEVGGEVPREFALEQNYPNPFNPATNIRFKLASTERVSLVVFDMLGREVVRLIDNEEMAVGSYSVDFEAARLASGMYVYRLDAGKAFSKAKTMVLLK